MSKSFSHVNSFGASRNVSSTGGFNAPYGAQPQPTIFRHSMNLNNTAYPQPGFRQPQFHQQNIGFHNPNQASVNGKKTNQLAIPRAYIEDMNANDKKTSSDLYV